MGRTGRGTEARTRRNPMSADRAEGAPGGVDPSRAGIKGLQGTVGNRAVRALLSNGGGSAHPEGDDMALEREAEQVARQVVAGTHAPPPAAEGGGEGLPAGDSGAGGVPPLSPPGSGVRTGIMTGLPIPVRSALSAQGRPLEAKHRSLLESHLGTDLRDVRLHVGARADRAARSLRARAFTLGSDIAFREGAYAPGSSEGLHLLAHEAAHVVQQRVVGERIQRTEDDEEGGSEAPSGVAFLFTVRVDRVMDSSALLLEFVSQYHGVPIDEAIEVQARRGWRWSSPGENPSVTPEDVANGYKLVRVRDRSIRQATPSERTQLRREYGRLPGAERRAITAETNRLFWERTQYRPGEELGDSPDDVRMRVYWNQIREELVRRRVAIRELPDPIREMIFGETGAPLRPSEYGQLLRVAEKLMSLTEEERLAYLERTTARTRDLSVFEAAIDRYMDELRERQRAAEERERAKTRLFGLDAVYRQYRDFIGLRRRGHAVRALGAAAPAGGGLRRIQQTMEDRAREDLTENLARHGFDSIASFEAAIDGFKLAFRTEARLIARELLDRYEHLLMTQEERYTEASAGSELHAQLAPARPHYEEARRYRRNAAAAPANALGGIEANMYWSDRAAGAEAQGRTQVRRLEGEHPLINESRLNQERLVMADDPATVMLDHIRDRRRDVHRTRRNLDEKPNLVWDLDVLVEIGKQQQDIQPGSIYDMIIQDHLRDEAISRAIVQIAIAILAIAAGLLTFGKGTIAVLGASAAFGIGAYTAWEEFRQWEVQHAAHGARLLSNDPSFAWVVVAVVGAGLDLAAAGAALRAMRGSVQTFNRTGDLLELERNLRRLSDVDDALRRTVMRAARAESEAKEAWRIARSRYYGRAYAVIDPLVTPLLNLAVHFTYPVYLSMRRGIVGIERFLLTREARSLIGNFRHLTPEQLARVRTAYETAVSNAQRVANHGHALRMPDSEIQHFLQIWNRNPSMSANALMDQMTHWAQPLQRSGRARWREAPEMILDPDTRRLLPDFEHRIAGTGGIERIRAREVPLEGRMSVTIEGEILPRRLTRRAEDVSDTRRRAPDFNTNRANLFTPEEAFPNLTRAQRAEWQRLHLWGPGFGDEAAAGMMWGPRNVNLRWQNDSVERYIRDLAVMAQENGARTRLRATAISWENPTPGGWMAPQGEHFLKRAQYEVTIVRPNQPNTSVTITLDVAEPPAVRAIPSIDPPHAMNLADLFP